MTKKIFLLMVIAIFSVSVFARRPVGIRTESHAGRRVVKENYSKYLAFFRTIKNSREKLGLTEKQNVQLDKILRDVENYNKSAKVQTNNNFLGDNFISDSFDPFKIDNARRRQKEEARKFYLSRIKAVHDLLTKKQREILVSIMKNRRTMMKRRNKKMWDRKKRMKERRDRRRPRNMNFKK